MAVSRRRFVQGVGAAGLGLLAGCRSLAPLAQPASGEPKIPRIGHLGASTNPLLGEQLADRLIEQERAKGMLTVSECLVPVPLHHLRQVQRGYNQAGVIATRLSRRCAIPVAQPAARTRNTETQTHQHSSQERFANLLPFLRRLKPTAYPPARIVTWTRSASCRSFSEQQDASITRTFDDFGDGVGF